MSDKIDYKIKNVTRDKEGHYIKITGSIWEEDITIINIYAPNTGAPQYIRQLLTAMKEEIDSNTVIVGNFNTSLKPMDRSSRQKINKETEALNDTIDQIDLIDIYRPFHPKTADHTFFSSALGHSPGLITSWVTNQASVNLRNWNHIKRLFRPQHYEIRNQLQGKKHKKHEHMEAKQYITK